MAVTHLLRPAGCSMALVLALTASLRPQPSAPPRPPTFPEPTKFDPRPATIGDGSAEVLAVAYSPDRETLATAGADKAVRLWEVGSGKLLATLEGHSDAVAGLAFAPGGKTLASASYDRTIKLWDVAARKELRTLSGHKNWVMGVAFSPDGATLASAG